MKWYGYILLFIFFCACVGGFIWGVMSLRQQSIDGYVGELPEKVCLFLGEVESLALRYGTPLPGQERTPCQKAVMAIGNKAASMSAFC